MDTATFSLSSVVWDNFVFFIISFTRMMSIVPWMVFSCTQIEEQYSITRLCSRRNSKRWRNLSNSFTELSFLLTSFGYFHDIFSGRFSSIKLTVCKFDISLSILICSKSGQLFSTKFTNFVNCLYTLSIIRRKRLISFIITSVGLGGLPYLSSIRLNISSRLSSTLLIKLNTVRLRHDFNTYVAGSTDFISRKTCSVKSDLNTGYFLMSLLKCGRLTFWNLNPFTVFAGIFLALLV